MAAGWDRARMRGSGPSVWGVVALLLSFAALVIGCPEPEPEAQGLAVDALPDGSDSGADGAVGPDGAQPALCTLAPLLVETWQQEHGWAVDGAVATGGDAPVLSGPDGALTLPAGGLAGDLRLELTLGIDALGSGDSARIELDLGSMTVQMLLVGGGEGWIGTLVAGGEAASVAIAEEEVVLIAIERRGERWSVADGAAQLSGPEGTVGALRIAATGEAVVRILTMGVSVCDPAPACADGTCGEDPCGLAFCNPLAGCGARDAAIVCDDGVACTVDSCDSTLGCLSTPDAGACDDGLPCNGVEVCGAGGCAPGLPPSGCCDGDEACADDSVCNGAEHCDLSTGTCQAGLELSCDDGNACNGSESCEPVTGCVGGVPPTCNDQNVCNGIETCDPQTGCVQGGALDCDDQNACTLEVCDPWVGCMTTLASCDDGNLCNGVEQCDPAVGCVGGVPLQCDDGKPCNGAEYCQPDSGCHVGVPQPGCCGGTDDCDDDNPCNGSAWCDASSGLCVQLPAPGCDDKNPCNGVEICDPQVGCVVGAPAVCGDGNVCNGQEACDPELGCTPGLRSIARAPTSAPGRGGATPPSAVRRGPCPSATTETSVTARRPAIPGPGASRGRRSAATTASHAMGWSSASLPWAASSGCHRPAAAPPARSARTGVPATGAGRAIPPPEPAPWIYPRPTASSLRTILALALGTAIQSAAVYRRRP